MKNKNPYFHTEKIIQKIKNEPVKMRKFEDLVDKIVINDELKFQVHLAVMNHYQQFN